MDGIRGKIKKIKYNRLPESEKFFLDIFYNLEEIKLKDKWTNTIFYKYNDELIMLKKLNKNLILIDDKIFYHFLTKQYNYYKYNIIMPDIINNIIKEYLNWNEVIETIETIEHEHLFIINEDLDKYTKI